MGSPDSARHTELSIIVPTYQASDVITRLDEELVSFLSMLGLEYEILYVDNGSDDNTGYLLKQLVARSPGWRRMVILRRNYGETAALMAGIDYAEGKVIMTFSSDLSSDPADIPKFLEAIEMGYDVVSGRRRGIHQNFWHETANRVISFVTRLKLRDHGTIYRAYRREIIKDVRVYGELAMYFPVFAMEAGARIVEIDTLHRADRVRILPFSPKRQFKMALDLLNVWFLSRYAVRPMYVFGAVGAVTFLAGLFIFAVALYESLSYQVSFFAGPLPYLAGLAWITGTQILLIGLSSELIVRILYQTEQQPAYKVREALSASEVASVESGS